MRDTLNRLLAYVTMQEETPNDRAATKAARSDRTAKKLKLDAETDDVSYDKLFDED